MPQSSASSVFKTSVDEVAARFIGRPTREMLNRLADEQGIPVPDDFRDYLLARVQDCFADELVATPNVREALERIRAPVCVASSSDLVRIQESLRLTGLLGFFAPRIFSAQVVSRGKPFPDLFELAARSLDVAPKRCLVIEDSTNGVQAGIAAGMTVFGYTGASHCGNGHAARLRAAGAALVFDDMAQLPTLIEEMDQQR